MLTVAFPAFISSAIFVLLIVWAVVAVAIWTSYEPSKPRAMLVSADVPLRRKDEKLTRYPYTPPRSCSRIDPLADTRAFPFTIVQLAGVNESVTSSGMPLLFASVRDDTVGLHPG